MERIECGEETFHQSRNERNQLVFHRLAKHLQGVKDAIDAAWDFLAGGQTDAIGRQVFKEDGQNVVGEFVDIRF